MTLIARMVCLSAIDGAESRFGSSMVIFTDAVEYDPTGETTYEETLQRVEDSDVMVHALGFGDDEASLESLFTLVEASGGSCFQAGDE